MDDYINWCHKINSIQKKNNNNVITVPAEFFGSHRHFYRNSKNDRKVVKYENIILPSSLGNHWTLFVNSLNKKIDGLTEQGHSNDGEI